MKTIHCILLTLALAIPMLAGPPLVCHPFETGDLKLLPWGSGHGWNSPDPGYNVAHLVTDTLRLLDDKLPVIGRMETLRRAAIYGASQPANGKELLSKLMTRAEQTTSGVAAFDAGYLIETYKQLGYMHKNKLAEGMDGKPLLERAARSGLEPGAVDYALALITGRWPNSHSRSAVAAARPGSLLSKNIAKHN